MCRRLARCHVGCHAGCDVIRQIPLCELRVMRSGGRREHTTALPKLDRNNTTEKKTSTEPIPECDCHRSYEHYQHWGTGIFPCAKGIRFCHWRGVARQSATTDIRCSQALADPIFPTFTVVSKYLTIFCSTKEYAGFWNCSWIWKQVSF
jgi:hypothetical protein